MKASMFFISMSAVFSTMPSNIMKMMSRWTNVKQSPDKYVNFCQQASGKIILFFFPLTVLFLWKVLKAGHGSYNLYY